MEGVIIRSTGSWYNVWCQSITSEIMARLKGSFRQDESKFTNPIAVGDIVVLTYENGDYIIDQIKERRNYIVRQSPKHRLAKHIIASNLDQAALIVSINKPRTSSGFIDRFITTAEAYNIPIVLIINKIDLYKSEKDNAILEEWMQTYTNLGYNVIATSAEEKVGLNELKNALVGKQTLFSGHSGVGKSSLLNAIDPSLNLRTNVISKVHEKGMHTTTYAEMFFSKELNANFIDTPGIKEFGVLAIEKHELKYYFREMAALLNQCKFDDCLHINEPQCKVMELWNEDKIADFRYQNYRNILDDIISQNDSWERK